MTTATTNAKSRRKAPSTPRAPRLTKKAQLIKILGAAAGADVITISTKLGWQAHTVRAALTGLRKAGHDVITEKPGQGKPTRYRIVGPPSVTASAETAATDPARPPMPGKADPDRDGLRQDWEEAFGSPPPAYASVAFLRKALAHEVQVKLHGGLPAATRRSLSQIATGRPVAEAARGRLRPGAHLVRDWNGRSYQVEVHETGFRLDGRTYPSLSAIARHITGTTWSGPRFFGLTDRAGGRG